MHPIGIGRDDTVDGRAATLEADVIARIAGRAAMPVTFDKEISLPAYPPPETGLGI